MKKFRVYAWVKKIGTIGNSQKKEFRVIAQNRLRARQKAVDNARSCMLEYLYTDSIVMVP